jgi:hypothetical protein
MKRKKTENMAQSAVRLPAALHERLRRAGGERGMGEEIRRRLEKSFEAEAERPSDPKTRELLAGAAFFARKVTDYFGDWSNDAFAFQVLKACLDMAIRRYQPVGDPALAKPNLTPSGRAIFGSIGENDNRSPEEFGRTLFGSWLISLEFDVKGPPGHAPEMSKEENRR